MDRQHTESVSAGRGWPHQFQRLMLTGLLLSLVACSSGCQIIIGSLLTLTGRPLIDADFKKYTGKGLEGTNKKVVVLCTSPESAKDVSSLDLDVIADVSSKFRQHDITVVDPHKVQSWIDDNAGNVDDADIVEIGSKFDADYLVHVKLDEFTYKEENSPNLFRGRSKGKVMVVEFTDVAGVKGKKRGRKIYDKVFSSVYPVHQPKSVSDISPAVFRKQYLARVSDELARFFYDHRPGEEF